MCATAMLSTLNAMVIYLSVCPSVTLEWRYVQRLLGHLTKHIERGSLPSSSSGFVAARRSSCEPASWEQSPDQWRRFLLNGGGDGEWSPQRGPGGRAPGQGAAV